MNRRRIALLCVALSSLTTSGDAQDRDPELAGVVPSNRAALGEALTARFAGCYEAEAGALGDGDRAVLRDALTPLALPVAEAATPTGCEGSSGEAACIDALRAMPCDALARSLASPPAPRETPPAWAAGYARVLTQRIVACYAAEADGGADDEVREALSRFERETARALGALSQREACRADEDYLPACSAAVMALSCDALGERLAGEPGALMRALGDACGRLVACEGDGDAGVDLDAVLNEPR